VGTVTLGGRTFEVAPLKFKHLRKILPQLDLARLAAPPTSSGVPEWVVDLAPDIVACGLVEVSPNGALPITAAWVDDLDAGEGRAIIDVALQVINATGINRPKGEGSTAPGEA
jgi:hypothetical protein